MTVAQYTRPDYTAQSAAAYKGNIDGMAAVFERFGNNFAPYANSPAAMNVKVAAGDLFVSGAIVSQGIQTTGTITAPVGNPRIDRVVIDAVTGAVSVITGTPAGSPTPPAITAGKLPVAQVLLQTSSTTITNSMITDERVGTGGGSGSSTVRTTWREHFASYGNVTLGTGPSYITPMGLYTLNAAGTPSWTASEHAISLQSNGSTRQEGGLYSGAAGSAVFSTAFKASADPKLLIRAALLGTNANDRFIGLSGAQIASGAAPSNGIYFRANTSGNWIAVCRASATESTLDTGVAATAGTYAKLEIALSAGGTVATVTANDTVIGTITSNIPSAALGFSFSSGPTTNAIGLKVSDIFIDQDME